MPLPPNDAPADAARGVQDSLARGLGIAAARMGLTADLYRPFDATPPLVPGNRVVRLHAAFTGADQGFRRPNGYGDAVWYGVFDSAYTRPGDYLVRGAEVWFVAAQPMLMPPLCVRAERLVWLSRPVPPTTAGGNAYGGVSRAAALPLLAGWPASILGAAGAGAPSAGLPADAGAAVWTVLLPALPGVTLRPADLLADDLGRQGVVAAAELSTLGWRLSVRQSTT